MAVDRATRFHETWLGMVQPVEGLVVSVPVLVDAQTEARQPPERWQSLLEACPQLNGDDSPRAIKDLDAFLHQVLDLTPRSAQGGGGH